MITCKKCGSEYEYRGSPCPTCGSEHTLTPRETRELLDEAYTAVKRRELTVATESFHLLADIGVTEAEREWAAMLERGALIPRDLDGAMKYFYRAAVKNDPYSAYRYSRLAARTSDKSSRFWLSYAAILGAKEAFPSVAEQYSDLGDEETASYYYALAAECDETDAIVTMAKRYYSGTGVPRSEEHAKWYMDRLTLPPFHALKLAYKLRGVKGKEPQRPAFSNRDAIMRALARDARRYGLHTAEFCITKMRAESADADALFVLGTLLYEGVGCEKNVSEAIACLDRAVIAGSPEAAKYLGDAFVKGIEVERDIDKAISYYKRATSLGQTDAYEAMGDIFYEGELVERDVAYAIELYERGAREGEANSRRKAAELSEKRESYFRIGRERDALDPETSFKCFAISATMGYLPAYRELAARLEIGKGAAKDRRSAFYWYEAAVKGGDLDALYDLGRCYAHGIGTAFSFDSAVDLLAKAKRYGSRPAEAELKRLYENKKRAMSRSLFSAGMRLLYQKKFSEAKELFEACSALDDPKAIYTLGCLCEFGLGTATDRDRAFELYDRAFDLKFRDPRQEYKLKILRMIR